MPISNKNSLMVKFFSRKEGWILLFILAVTAASLSSSLFGEFTNWDDHIHVLNNPSVSSLNPQGVVSIFQDIVNRTYIPLTTLSFAIEHHVFGFNPFVYHLTNVLLHLSVTVLIFLLGLRMGLKEWGAAAAALLFGIHPMHVESVAWITQRKDVLYAFFYLLAVHSYLTYIKRCHPEHSEGSFVKDSSAFGLRMTIAEKGHKSFFVLAIVFGIFSMLAKPMALSLPLILFLCDRFCGRKLDRKSFFDKIPFFAYIIPISWITYSLYTRIPGENAYHAILIWIWSFSFYLQKFFFPVDLCPLYPPPTPVSLTNPVHMISVAVFLLTILCLWIWRQNRWVWFAIGYYVLSIFFLFRFDVYDDSIVADRFMYLPSVGFCFLFGFWVQHIPQLQKRTIFKSVAVIGVIALFFALSVKTFFQCRIWKDSITVWSQMLDDIPDHWFALCGRAKAYELQKQYDLALADYQRTLSVKPDLVWVYENRGTMLFNLGREDEALKDLDQAILLESTSAEVFNNRSLIHSNRKNYAAALADLDKAIALKPDYLTAYHNRGLLYAALKQYDRALEDFDRGLVLDPSNAELYYCRSLAHVSMNRWDAAIQNAIKAGDLGYPGMDGYLDSLHQQRLIPH